MAERRMFAKKVVTSARFLRMPSTAQLLYFQLGMQADDDGVVEAFTVMRTTGSTEDDLRALVDKGFIAILNDDLVAYIEAWKQNNQIRPDRYKPSMYADLLEEYLKTKQPNDTQRYPDGIPTDNQTEAERETQVSIGKVSNKGNKEDKERKGMFSEENTHAPEPPPASPPLSKMEECLYRSAMNSGKSHDEAMAWVLRKRKAKDGDGV